MTAWEVPGTQTVLVGRRILGTDFLAWAPLASREAT